MTIPFSPGDTVQARGRLWRLHHLIDHGDCASLELDPAGPGCGPGRHVILMPFDRCVAPSVRSTPLLVSPAGWWRRMAARLLALRPHDALVSPLASEIDILPHQLEPSIATVAGGAHRLLLADAVGLGKTIQAGMILAELFARGVAHRALVLVPSGLRDQWASELRARFRLDVDVIDSAALRALAASLPVTVNPWMVPRVAIVSFDFAKRPEVRHGLLDVSWDIVAIDEAHLAAGDSDRYRAVHALACRARRVILITATPHAGTDSTFAALAGLGASGRDEPLVMFRRSRLDVGIAHARRTRLLCVRPGPAELHAIRTLLAYARLLWSASSGAADARLVAILLLKRALSSPASLERSVVRRRALIGEGGELLPVQLALPLDEDRDDADDEPGAALGARGLDDTGAELAWLDQIAAAAGYAAREHRKLRALGRLLRRIQEPAVVFTEYRDTLRELETALERSRRCVSLHGGLDRQQRESVLDAFGTGRADVLLATDAAGAGLNLHQRCRLVVNLEIPWSPIRIEQRIGRVDRIGQRRTVHAIHLVGASTPEERLLARLAHKAERARAALGDSETAWPDAGNEMVTAEALLGLRPAARRRDVPTGSPSAGVRAAALIERPVLTAEAVAEASSLRRRIAIRDALARRTSRRFACRPSSLPAAPVVACLPARPGRPADHFNAAPGILAVFEVCIVDGHGNLVDETLLPIRLSGALHRPASRRDALALAKRLLKALPVRLGPWLEDATRNRVRFVEARIARASEAAGARERALAQRAHAEILTLPGLQGGLFDLRGEREAERVRRAAPVLDSVEGLAAPAPGQVEGSRSCVLARPPRLAWILVVSGR